MGVMRISPPQLRTKHAEGDRKATWLELFYDLAFVVAVAVASARLMVDVGWAGLASFAGYFVLIWWLWASHTYYADRYDTDDLVYRLLAAGQMVAVVIIAASLTLGEAGSTRAFSFGYAISRLLLVVMYWRAYRHVDETRRLVRGYLAGFGLAALVWSISAFVGEEIRIAVWSVALTIDLATPWVMRKEQAKAPLDVSHLPERFGLFTILVLGESILGVVTGLSHSPWAMEPTLAAVMGIGIASALWWLYFENTRGSIVRRDALVRASWRPTIWIYTHLPLAIALAVSGVAIELAVSGAGHGVLTDSARWLMVGAVAVSLVTMTIINAASNTLGATKRQGIVRLTGVVALVLVGLVARLEAQWVMLCVLAVCLGQVISDMRRQEIPDHP